VGPSATIMEKKAAIKAAMTANFMLEWMCSWCGYWRCYNISEQVTVNRTYVYLLREISWKTKEMVLRVKTRTRNSSYCLPPTYCVPNS
jgi:RNase P subunit RPR2